MTDRARQLLESTANRATLCALLAQREYELKQLTEAALRMRETPIVDDDFTEHLHNFDRLMRHYQTRFGL